MPIQVCLYLGDLLEFRRAWQAKSIGIDLVLATSKRLALNRSGRWHLKCGEYRLSFRGSSRWNVTSNVILHDLMLDVVHRPLLGPHSLHPMG